MADIFAVHGETETSAVLDGLTWTRATGLSGPVGQFVLSGSTYTLLLDGNAGTGVTAVIPEPTTTALLAAGTNHPPFERDGQEVVRAYVFTCGESGEPKVSYLMKYTPEGRSRLVAADANAEGDYTDTLDGMPPQEVLFKKPVGGSWVPGNDPRIRQLKSPACPDGLTARAVLPGRS